MYIGPKRGKRSNVTPMQEPALKNDKKFITKDIRSM